ncbi:hypothetical protein P4637_13405 [Halalkalibacterium halodurans]|jgi:hypothetical protein|uniref:hypothetical protein n=1 Tax=Halalkalibacterium halodurans TaxID=86665 RepID=UPI0010FD5713|nr:hypothetical protein [Halalkalibacterium halodurans]MDY7220879.1 hypothetical protein [Halalkalibacterium halodurans]MDY7240118.1 hypothetical protein [Halalkalibacterium halodurans]MED4082563.1 hypothetical protein [Halalkalibacterium halodurans]MED4085808.1 hypothetical protein [Halalkalibacterium halodurans]MED4105674.1 hypothetical protein [Halalkalibacterium halodurans]
MTAWLDLTKKEFRLGLPAFIFSLVFLIGMFAIGILIGRSLDMVWELLTFIAFAAITLHSFYLVYYMLYSLDVERKRMHLWLHNPLPTSSLLLAKLVSGSTYMLITFIISVTVLWQAFGNSMVSINSGEWLGVLTLWMIYLMITTILFGCTYLFFWTIFMALSKTYNDFLSFVFTFIFFVGAVWLLSAFDGFPFLTWGAIHIGNIPSGVEFSISNEVHHFEIEQTTTVLYLSHFVRDLALAILLFGGGCWILDRKVEV